MDKFNDSHLNGGVYRQRLRVEFEYPVYFRRAVFTAAADPLSAVFNRGRDDSGSTVQFYLDSGLVQARPRLLRDIERYVADHSREGRLCMAGPPLVIPGGETVKNGWKSVDRVLAAMAGQGLDRHSFVVGVGGGAMLDALGLAASLVHRGLRLVRIPTTTLAQCDAGIGVKNGIDVFGIKNFAGTFAPPVAVVVDSDFLSSLPFSHWIGGVAEAFKVAMIKDRDFFTFLCRHAAAFRKRDERLMEEMIRRCAVIHLDHIREGGDPFESGSARPLDFGHWAAHQLECLSDHRISHGQAVAIGLALDSHYAMQKGLLSGAEFEIFIKGLTDAGLPVWHPQLDRHDDQGNLMVLAGLDRFREHLGGRLTVTLPHGIGARCEVLSMENKLIEAAIGAMKQQAKSVGHAGKSGKPG